MTIDLPLLDNTFETLHRDLATIPYILLVAALIRQVYVSDGTPMKVIQIMGKLIVVCVVIHYARPLYGAVEHFFLSIAGKIDSEYLKYPLGLAGEMIKESQGENLGFWKTITGGGVFDSMWLGFMSFVVMGLSFIQVPLLIIQYFIVKAGFLVFPFIMTLFMYPSLASIAFRYITHILSVMAWPIGFAMANLIAYQILKQFDQASVGTATLMGNKSGTASGSMAASMTAGLIMVFGMFTTPKMMSGLFSSGVGLASAGGEFMRSMATGKMLLGKSVRGVLSTYGASKGAYSFGKRAYTHFKGGSKTGGASSSGSADRPGPKGATPKYGSTGGGKSGYSPETIHMNKTDV